jgi:hypothetical protein
MNTNNGLRVNLSAIARATSLSKSTIRYQHKNNKAPVYCPALFLIWYREYCKPPPKRSQTGRKKWGLKFTKVRRCNHCGRFYRANRGRARCCGKVCEKNFQVFTMRLSCCLKRSLVIDELESKKKAFICAGCGSTKAPDSFTPFTTHCSRKCVMRGVYHRSKVTGTYKARVKKKLSNPLYRIGKSHRNRIQELIRSRFMVKTGSSIKLLGCSGPHLKAHLESMFQPGMGWHNYGNKRHQWSVDHIIPISSFKLLDELEKAKCFHYSNLQPMWHVDNMAKGNKMPTGATTNSRPGVITKLRPGASPRQILPHKESL